MLLSSGVKREIMIYVIKGDPIALARPRYNKRTVYDAQKNKKLVAGIELRNQHGSLPFLEGALHLDINFFLKIPTKSKHSCLDNRYHIYRPDLSNLLKFIEDIGTGIIYKDDSIICSINASKRYSVEPRTEFEVTVLKRENCGKNKTP